MTTTVMATMRPARLVPGRPSLARSDSLRVACAGGPASTSGRRKGQGPPSATATPRTGDDTEEQQEQDDVLEKMRVFSEKYAKQTETYFCSDPQVTAVVIKGLADHKEELGAPLCPCRHYEDKEAEAAQGFWNCPCVPMRERREGPCMLFLTEDNAFRADHAVMDYETLVRELPQDD